MNPKAIALFAATVAEEAQASILYPASATTSVLGAIFNNPRPPGFDKRLSKGEYDGLHWEDKNGQVSLIMPGIGRWTALDYQSCNGSENYTSIPE